MSYELIYPEDKKAVNKEGLGSKILRNVTAATGKALNTIPNLITTPERLQNATQENALKSAQSTLNNPNVPQHLKGALKRYTEESKNNNPLISFSKIQNKVNEAASSLFPENYLEPKNKVEEEIQDVLANIGFNTGSFLASGGTFNTVKEGGKFLYDIGKRALQGKAGKYAAKGAGLGDIGQIIAEIGTPAALETLNVKNLVKSMYPTQEKLYNETNKAAGYHKIDAGNIKTVVKNKLDSKVLKSPQYKQLRNNLNEIFESVDSNNMIDVSQAFKIKTNLNELLYDSKLSDIAKKDYKQFLPLFNNILNDAGKKYKDFGRYYHQANNITRIINESKKTSKFIEDAFEKTTFLHKPIGYLFKTPIKSARQASNALSAAGQLSIDHPKQFMEYYSKALQAASKKSLPTFINNVSKMDKLIKDDDNESYELIYE